MNDTIFNGRDVTKNATYRVEAFQSRDLGPLGLLTVTARSFITISRCANTRWRPRFDVAANLESLPRVDGVILRRR
jgi:L-asparaginase/Glu-tRNA(Gln) amidotransferase subunit D